MSLAVVLPLVVACARPTPYDAPGFAFLQRYRAAPAGAPVLLANAAWWTRLKDPVLDRLVARALGQNLSIEIARTRVEEAQAQVRAVPGAATLSSSLGARVEGSGSTGPDVVGTGRIGLDWMLDPWGGRRAELRALGAEAEIAAAEVDAARLLVLYNLSGAYIDLRYRQRLLTLAQSELRSRRALLDLVQKQAEQSSATRLDITRARARVAQIEAELPGDEAAVAVARNRIAVLVGVQPGALDIDLGFRDQPVARLRPDVGIPADLLRNRPDIRIAERAYYAAVSRIDRARAALYPTLSLSGAISVNALQGTGNATSYYLGPSLSFPVLPTDAARASVTVTHARARQAHLTWTDTVLGALLEVENALVSYQAATRALEASSRAARLYGQSRNLTRDVFDSGATTLDDLINAELDRSDAERALATAIYQQALAFVELNVRLGSGSAAGE